MTVSKRSQDATELLDGVSNADESEKESYSQSLLEWRQLTACTRWFKYDRD